MTCKFSQMVLPKNNQENGTLVCILQHWETRNRTVWKCPESELRRDKSGLFLRGSVGNTIPRRKLCLLQTLEGLPSKTVKITINLEKFTRIMKPSGSHCLGRHQELVKGHSSVSHTAKNGILQLAKITDLSLTHSANAGKVSYPPCCFRNYSLYWL